MKSKMVKEIMAPVSEYTAISQEATLHEAILALKTYQGKFEPVMLVHNGRQKIIGVITRLDVLRGLEHAYKKIGDLRHVSHSGFSPEFIKSLIKQYGFWQRPLGEICNKSVDTKIKDFMYTPDEGEFVDQDASLDEAIHQLIMGNHHNLLVTRNLEIVGILRLRDMFNEIYRRTKACET
jgi:CBS domain containing-hemolysin-like protein